MAARDSFTIDGIVTTVTEKDTAFGTEQKIRKVPFTYTPASTIVDTVYHDYITQNTSAVDYDLVGSLVDPFNGVTKTFQSVAFIFTKKVSGTGDIKVGGDAASIPLFGAVNDILISDDMLALLNLSGWTVTATSADILQIETTGNIVFELIVAGLAP